MVRLRFQCYLFEHFVDILRPAGQELRKKFPFSNFTEQALKARVMLKNWPSSVIIYPGCAVGPDKVAKKEWIVLGSAMKREEGFMQIYCWDEGMLSLAH